MKRTEAQQRAAWALYVEYATRIATQPLKAGEGSVREALNSLHSLFDATRETLKAEGPGVAEGPESIGVYAIRVLNEGVRPFLTTWHGELATFEDEQTLEFINKGGRGPAVVDEAQWVKSAAFYRDLEKLRKKMLEFVSGLALVAGVSTPAPKRRRSKR